MAEFNWIQRPKGKGTLKYRRIWDSFIAEGITLLSVDYNGMILVVLEGGTRKFVTG